MTEVPDNAELPAGGGIDGATLPAVTDRDTWSISSTSCW